MSTQTDLGVVPEFDLADRMRRALRHADAAPTAARSRLRTGVSHRWLRDGESPRQDGPDGGSTLPRLDSNQRPSGYTLAQVTPLRAAA